MKLKLKNHDEIDIDIEKHSIALVDGLLMVFNHLGECVLKHLLASPEEVVIKI